MTTPLLTRPFQPATYRRERALFRTRGDALLAAIVAFLLIVFAFAASSVWLNVAVLALIASIGAIGLQLLTGYTGLVSIGHAAFLGIGAYAAGVLGGNPGGATVALGLPWPVWLFGAGVVTALVGVAIGPLALRFREIYLAVLTLALVFVGEHVFRNAGNITGGSAGKFLAQPVVGGLPLGDATGMDVFGGLITVGPEVRWYFFTLVVATLCWITAKNMGRRRVGRAMQAVRDRDLAAEAMGINVVRIKLLSFGISSFYAGISGALFGSFIGNVRPETFDLDLSIEYLAMVIIGGMGSLLGAVLGAFFVTSLPQLLREVLPGGVAGFSVFELVPVVYGVVVVAFLVLYPEGFGGTWDKIRTYWTRWPFRT